MCPYRMKRMSESDSYSKATMKDGIPTWTFLLVVLALGLLYLGVQEAYNSLPKPVMIKDEPQNAGRFVAERAEIILRKIVDLGKRPGGSRANEILARDLILDELKAVKQQADPAHRLDIAVQITSGQFNLGFKPYGMTSVYSSVQNVLVRVSPGGGAAVAPANHSLLINCHFDSVEAGPGATDDALNCAVMLEALRVVTAGPHAFRHNLVFLFNGAEENGLQASHGFITQHEWAKNIRAFINLEGAGSGGKEIMFQAGPEHPWLLDHYADVAPYPHAQAIAEELFQSGIIPSDTDFRIFRDFGHIPGMDFAHARNGYVYHTKYDDINLIKLGTYQHTGDNLVAMLRSLGDAEELADTASYAEGENVFFDVFGLFIIAYTEVTGIIINVFVILCTLITIGLSLTSMANDEGLSLGEISTEFGISILTQVAGWLVALVSAAAFGWILDLCGRALSWYSQPWLLVGLYIVPSFLAIAGASLMLLRFKKRRMSMGHFVQLQTHCLCTMLIFLLTVLTAANLRSAYALLIVVLMYEISLVINVLTGYQNKARKWLFAHLALQVPPISFSMYLMIMGLDVLIPIAGRSGPAMNPEYLIGILTTFLSLVIGSFIMPLTSLLRQPRLVILSGLGVVLTFVVIVATPVGFPYGDSPDMPTPQRYWVFHSERTLYNEDLTIRANNSGVFMLPMDRNSPGYIKSYVPMMKNVQPVAHWCESELFCGLPFYTSRMHQQSNYSHWLPMERPKIPPNDIVHLNLLRTELVAGTSKRYYFELDGPSHMGVFISPYTTAKISSWSITDNIPNSSLNWGNRSTYFIYHSYGINKTTFKFHIDIETSLDLMGPQMDIAVTGHFMHLDVLESEEFREYLKSFPSWSHVSSWISTIKSFKY